MFSQDCKNRELPDRYVQIKNKTKKKSCFFLRIKADQIIESQNIWEGDFLTHHDAFKNHNKKNTPLTFYFLRIKKKRITSKYLALVQECDPYTP